MGWASRASRQARWSGVPIAAESKTPCTRHGARAGLLSPAEGAAAGAVATGLAALLRRETLAVLPAAVADAEPQRSVLRHRPPAPMRHSGRICTLRHLIGPPGAPCTPAPYCSANGPPANLPLFIVTVTVPLNLTVTCEPRASIS